MESKQCLSTPHPRPLDSIPIQIPSRLGPGEFGGGLVNVAEPFQNFQDAMAGAVGLRASIENLLAWGVAHLPGSDAGDQVLREAVEMATQVQKKMVSLFFSSAIRNQELTTQRVASTVPKLVRKQWTKKQKWHFHSSPIYEDALIKQLFFLKSVSTRTRMWTWA